MTPCIILVIAPTIFALTAIAVIIFNRSDEIKVEHIPGERRAEKRLKEIDQHEHRSHMARFDRPRNIRKAS